MIALTEERKRQIIDEEPEGLWLVLDEEYPRDAPSLGELLCGDLETTNPAKQPAPASSAVPADAFFAKDRD
ncbi:MAG: hypothetical protein L0Z50_36790 [Verrucomicrobiales bacterium]|nr:hypothetical protein [Verrucomicrobiales bacterium]